MFIYNILMNEATVQSSQYRLLYMVDNLGDLFRFLAGARGYLFSKLSIQSADFNQPPIQYLLGALSQ
jgi:hypothetical protein